ncbi:MULTISPECIES: DMT family transporter [Actinomyces]|uniref:DMT family transporter n=1 Tax=Actinomyces respiraculi TaxID=2744574 RepID=A0A7T0LLW2_9ACTO|nr:MULTISPECIES: DMT family transporter [Actinomyces]QPL06181.1 DMT family transporter [Actinomyces respiraculi]
MNTTLAQDTSHGARRPRRLPGAATARLCLLATTLVVLQSLTWLAVRVALDGTSTAIVSAGRVGFTVVALGLLTVNHRRTESHAHDSQQHTGARPLRHWQAAALSIAGVSGYTALSTVAVQVSGTLLPALIVSTGPLWVLVLVSLRRRSAPGRAKALGTLVAVVGGAFFLLAGSQGVHEVGASSVLGTLLAVGAVLLMSVYTVAFAALTRGYQGPMAPVITPIYAWGLAPLAVWAFTDLLRGARLTPTTLAVLAALGLLVYLPVYLIQHRLLAEIGAHPVSLLGLAVSPLVAVETAGLGLGLWPSSLQWLAIAITLAGTAIVIGPRRRPKESPSESPKDATA